MAKKGNEKLKLLHIMHILLEQTDEMHGITVKEIADLLEKHEIFPDRKSIYNDIKVLQEYGLNIEKKREDRTVYYYLKSRLFSLAELKLLVDSVQASKFITTKKSRELINKIEGMVSKHQGKELQRQVYVADRVKAENEKIYENVDKIHFAIARNSQITFQYLQWNLKKELEAKHNGRVYEVSPWALGWAEENYYLISFDNTEKIIKHFRVDKMQNVEVRRTKRLGRKEFEHFDMAIYAKKMFGMYGGKEELVTLRCSNETIGIIIDRFGKDILVMKDGEKHFITKVKVSVSNQFFGWIFGLGDRVEIAGPDWVVKGMREELQMLYQIYEKNKTKK